MKPVLVVDKIQKYYGNRGNITKAVDNISFSVEHGEFVGDPVVLERRHC